MAKESRKVGFHGNDGEAYSRVAGLSVEYINKGPICQVDFQHALLQQNSLLYRIDIS